LNEEGVEKYGAEQDQCAFARVSFRSVPARHRRQTPARAKGSSFFIANTQGSFVFGSMRFHSMKNPREQGSDCAERPRFDSDRT
jgi:hypothetical protein